MDTSSVILQRATADPRRGFAALHQRHAARLAMWASLQVGPTPRRRLGVDDLVQEIWTRAYAAFASFDSERGGFRAWLFGIAYNVLREQLRSLHRRGSDAAATDSFEVGGDLEPRDPATSIRSTLVAREERSAVIELLDSMPIEERRIVVWRALEGLSFPEIGARLGIGASAAESRWRRIVSRLQTRLRGSELAGWLTDGEA